MKRIVIVAAVVAAMACDRTTPTAPSYGARGSHLQYGRAVDGFLRAPDTALFYLDAQAGDLIAAYASSTDSTVLVAFADSGQPLYGASYVKRGTALGDTAVFTYTVPETGPFAIALVRGAAAGGSQAQYALRVDTVYIGPEHIKPGISQGQIVSGESIDSVGDIDVFTFSGTAGKEVVGYIQAIAQSTDGVTLTLYGTDPDSVLAQMASPGGDTSLEYWTTNATTLPHTGTYHVKVQAATGSYVGAYRFEIYPVDSAPESISANVTPGDTVQGESIDHVGDVDVFTVKGKGGASYNMFAQYTGTPGNTIQVYARDASGTALATIWPTAMTPVPALTAGPGSGVFAAPASGQFTITVSTDGGILNRGPYRLFLYPINSAPEIAPANFNLGDSVTTETIGLPGDTDTFSMHVSQTTLASVCITAAPAAAATGAPAFVLYGPSGNIVGEQAIQTQLPGPQCAPGLTAAPGNYSLVIWGPYAFRGLYKINSYAFSAAPEHVSPVITLGDTVSGESIDAPGDYDTFTFRAHAYSMVGIDVIAGTPNLNLTWSLIGTGLEYQFNSGGAGLSGRQDLDSAGTFSFVMASNWANAVGPYKFVFYPWPVAPEHHAATVALGTAITDELIDYPGDVDQFTLTGTPGGYGIVSLQAGVGGLAIEAMIMSSDSTFLTDAPSGGYLQYSQRFQMPASGNLILRVRQFPGEIGGTGQYAVNTIVVNPAPEHVPAATAIGDTVSGESIDYIGDLDQFTFSGTAGQKIVVEFQTPQGVGGNSMVLELLAPDGTLLGQVTSLNPSPLPSQTTGVVTLPTTGQYTIAVSGGVNGQSPATGPYVFAILPSS